MSPTPAPLPTYQTPGPWKGTVARGVQLLKSRRGRGAGADSKAHLVSGRVPGGLGALSPTWPPATVAGSEPWPREALAGGAGALTGAGLVSSALEGLAAAGRRKGEDAEAWDLGLEVTVPLPRARPNPSQGLTCLPGLQSALFFLLTKCLQLPRGLWGWGVGGARSAPGKALQV